MDRFSSRHFIMIVLSTCIVSLKTYPTIFIKNGLRESWIAIIIASILFVILFTFIVKICKKSDAFSLTKIYIDTLGEKMGKFFIYILILTLLITLIECAAVEANSMRTNMLLETPIWYLLIFFIIPCIYVIRQDIAAIIISCMILLTLIIFSGSTLAMLTSRYKHISYLFPVFQKGLNWEFFICIIKMFGLYGCATIALPYLSKIDDTKKIVKHAFIAFIIVIQMHIVSISGLIMTFQIDKLINLVYPKLIQTQLISYQRFLEFGELYVLFQVLGGWLVKYIVTFYAILILLKELNLKRKSLIYIMYIFSVLVFIGSNIAAENTFLLFKLLNYYSYICLINFVIIPTLIFTRYSSVARKMGKR